MKALKLARLALFGLCPLLASCNHHPSSETPKEEQSAVGIVPEQNSTQKEPQATQWVIDTTTSQVKFTIKNMGMTVSGSFGGFSGSLFFDPANLNGSKMETAVRVNSIRTGIKKRDKDLMDEKFFDESHHTLITYRSDSVIRTANGYAVAGTLTIKGVSAHRVITFVFAEKDNTAQFNGSLVLNRLDYGIGKDGALMGNEVTIAIEVVARKVSKPVAVK